MSKHTRAMAEAFSGHRFAETYQHLAADVEWVAVGHDATVGKAAVIAACDAASTEATTTIEVTRLVVAADDDTAAVDMTSRYANPDGTTSVVSSCDVYEFRGDDIVRITSYAVEEASR